MMPQHGALASGRPSECPRLREVLHAHCAKTPATTSTSLDTTTTLRYVVDLSYGLDAAQEKRDCVITCHCLSIVLGAAEFRDQLRASLSYLANIDVLAAILPRTFRVLMKSLVVPLMRPLNYVLDQLSALKVPRP